jgi:antitoxin HigA-1
MIRQGAGLQRKVLRCAQDDKNRVAQMSARKDIFHPDFHIRGRTRASSHPGELMREIIEEHVELSVTEAARRMGVSRQALHAVLRGRTSVSADMALRFAQLVGGQPELFLRMQENLDLWTARQRLGARLARIAPVTTKRAA